MGMESCKIVFPGGHFLFTCSNTFVVGCRLSFIHSAQRHRQTDRQTALSYHYSCTIGYKLSSI